MEWISPRCDVWHLGQSTDLVVDSNEHGAFPLCSEDVELLCGVSPFVLRLVSGHEIVQPGNQMANTEINYHGHSTKYHTSD